MPKYGLYQLESGYDGMSGCCTVNISVVITEDIYKDMCEHSFSFDASQHAYENMVEVNYDEGSFTEVSETFAKEWKKLKLDRCGEYTEFDKQGNFRYEHE
jgi:hypothetical protein